MDGAIPRMGQNTTLECAYIRSKVLENMSSSESELKTTGLVSLRETRRIYIPPWLSAGTLNDLVTIGAKDILSIVSNLQLARKKYR